MKTLKDIYNEMAKDDELYDTIDILNRIKDVAKEHIRELEKDRDRYSDNYSDFVIGWIKEFFNLEEE